MSRAAIKAMRESLLVGAGALALLLSAGNVRAADAAVVAAPGKPALLLSGFDLEPLGFSTEEFFVSGTATSYQLDAAATADGRWNASSAGTSPYATRIVVVRPTNPKKFNGTVVIEWLNVTAGADGAPDWNAAHREILRNGYVYVGVSAQKAGVEAGGAGLLAGLGGAPLKKANPERYGRLNHPGDAYSYDMFTQVGGLFRSAGAKKILGPLSAKSAVKRVIAVGESQSAAFLTTYVNAVDRLAKTYDGFLIHSRFGSAASLENAAMAGGREQPRTVQFRSDLRVPVIAVLTETDVLDGQMPGYRGARVPDTKHLRVWEVPGTSHADSYTFTVGFIDSGSAPLDKIAAGYAPTNKLLGTTLAKPLNNAPQHHYVVSAALWNLDRWIRQGKLPTQAAPMKMREGDKSGELSLDANGLAEGGVRTPWMDVPTARLSGVGNSGGFLGMLVGVCEPFDAATLDRLYPKGRREYMKKFNASLSSAISAGFILPADKKEILQLAEIAYRGSR